MDPVTPKLAMKGGLILAKWLRSKIKTAQQIHDETFHELWAEVQAETAAALQRIEELTGQTLEQLAEKISEREARALFMQLSDEAVKSPTRNRMRLMCAALAGIFEPELSGELKSRLTRIATQLEPSDILLLGQDMSQLLYADAMKQHWHSMFTLMIAGCIESYSSPDSRHLVRPTQFGYEMLTFVRTWQPRED